jgi:hypothetical protein
VIALIADNDILYSQLARASARAKVAQGMSLNPYPLAGRRAGRDWLKHDSSRNILEKEPELLMEISLAVHQ